MVLPSIKHDMNVSFSGCGFLGIYHIGVASCLKTYAPYLLENKLCGSSAGAISACCLLCDVPLGECSVDGMNLVCALDFFFKFCIEFRSRTLKSLQVQSESNLGNWGGHGNTILGALLEEYWRLKVV